VSDLVHSPALIPAGATGILALVVLLILRGYLVPRRTMDQFLRIKDERLADSIVRGDEYKKAAEIYREALSTRDSQLGEILEYARTADAFFRSLREETRK
jgi:hypothetical protein